MELYLQKNLAKPKNNIEDLEESVVYIEMVLTNLPKRLNTSLDLVLVS